MPLKVMLDSDEISSFEAILDVKKQEKRIMLSINLEIGKFGEESLYINSYKFHVSKYDGKSKFSFCLSSKSQCKARATKSIIESVIRLNEMHNHSSDIDGLLKLSLISLIMGRIFLNKFILANKGFKQSKSESAEIYNYSYNLLVHRHLLFAKNMDLRP